MDDEEVLTETKAKRTLIACFKKRELTFLGYVMREENLENLPFKGHIEGKTHREKTVPNIPNVFL